MRESLQRRQALYGPTHRQIATGLHNLARVLTAQGRTLEAETTFREALAMRRETLHAQDPLIAQTLEQLADLLRSEGRTEEACSLHQEALTIYTEAHGPKHTTTAGVREALEGC